MKHKHILNNKPCNRQAVPVTLASAVLTLLVTGSAQSAILNLSDKPLFLGTTVEPNIFLVIDDSGSMDWEVLKTSGALAVHGTGDNSGNLDFTPNNNTDRRELCVGYNALAYNPAVNYRPWSGLDSAGNAYQDQTIAAARTNPFSTTGTRSLANDYYYPWNDDGDGVYENGECQTSTSSRIFINTLPADQQTNYANWYSYYRKREYVAKAAYGSVVVDAQASRVGMMTINRNNSVNMPVRSMNADFNTGNKRALMDKLYNIDSSGGTPLQNAMYRAGEYLSGGSTTWLRGGSSENFPDPRLPVNDGGICQQNFEIVMTDGYYNGSFDFNVGNTDTDGAGPWDGGTYADNASNTLADIAMRYYEEDLNAAAPAGVPTNAVDTNTEQHVVTYTVAFGVDGTLRCSPGETVDLAGNACPSPFPGWSAPNTDAQRIDDLRHAAYNGRGLFLSAENPQRLIQSINDAIGNILSRTSSSAGVAFNSTSLQSNSILFQGQYQTSDWSGNLRFLPVNSLGGVGSAIANTSDVLNAMLPDDRTIVTVNSATNFGAAFRWSAISPAQQTLLGNEDVLNYLRGDKSCEVNSPLTCLSGNKVLRNRSTVLGDIIHSSAVFVGAPNRFYDFDGYNSFAGDNANRTPLAFVGANDGMLHGFNASTATDGSAIPGVTGAEVLAFVPSVLFNRLRDITDTSYIHSYYVDGTPVVGDAFYGGAWHTVLTSGLRGGGQEVFALDITDPGKFDEANAGSLVMWEFTDADDADLGYTFGEPVITKMANGRFAAIVGNGYNSTAVDGHIGSGEAVLFIIDLETGNATKLSTGRGTLADPNGLSAPTVIDTDGDFIADFAYAGDLHGNLWRFDLTNPDPGLWAVSFGKEPLFTAVSPEGDRQPITSRPSFMVRSGNEGSNIYFGTGKYLELSDNITLNNPTQSIYAVWDKWTKDTGDTSFVTFSRSALQQQTILEERTINGTDARLTSSNSVDWSTQYGWYMDLVNPQTNDNQGERIVTTPLVRNGQLFFSTLIPSAAACQSGGTGWLMALEAMSGGRLAGSPFDVNNDGIFDDADKVALGSGGSAVAVAVSGAKSSAGIISQPVIIESESGQSDFIGVSNSNGLVGIGNLFGKSGSTPGTPGGAGGGNGTNSGTPGPNGSLDEIARGIPFGRILWQQLK